MRKIVFLKIFACLKIIQNLGKNNTKFANQLWYICQVNLHTKMICKGICLWDDVKIPRLLPKFENWKNLMANMKKVNLFVGVEFLVQ
jgi:hypothetical protein